MVIGLKYTKDILKRVDYKPGMLAKDILATEEPEPVAPLLATAGRQELTEAQRAFERREASKEGVMLGIPEPTSPAYLKTLYPDIPDLTLDAVRGLAQADPDTFLRDLITKGRTKETELLLKEMGATDQLIDEIYTERVIIPEQVMVTVNERGVDVRKLANIDPETGDAYDLMGNRVGTYNPVTLKVETQPKEGVLKDLIDTLHYSARQYWELGEGFMLGVLPEILFRDMSPLERKIQGDKWANITDARNQKIRETFRWLYSENKQEYEGWLQKHPEIVPRKDYQEGAFQHPELLKDSLYYVYELATIVPFIVAATGVAVATGGVGVPFVIGTAALMAPVEGGAVYQELLDAGAPEDKAAPMAAIAGTIMGLLESAGRIPLLKQVSPLLFRQFKQEATRQLVRRGFLDTVKKFGRNFAISEFSEVITEVLQEVVSNTAVSFYDKNRSILENLPDIAVKTAVATLIPGVGGAGVSIKPSIRTDIETRVKETMGEAVERIRVAPERGALGFPEEKPQVEQYITQQTKGMTVEQIETLRTDLATKKEKQVTLERQYGKGFADDVIIGLDRKIAELRGVPLPKAPVTPEVTRELIYTSGERMRTWRITDPIAGKQWIEEETTKGILKRDVIAIPKAEAGMPEAGLQPTMLPEEVAAREVRPPGKGEIVQISMADQLKLEQARRAAEEAPAELKEAYEAQAELEGIQATLETDPVAQYTFEQTVTKKVKQPDGTYKLKQFKRKVGLESLISIREQTFPSFFTLKQARAIKPFGNFTTWEQKGLPTYNKVPTRFVLDELADKWGMTVDEIANRVMQVRQEKQRVKEAQETIKRQMTEKPLAPTTDLTPAEVKENWLTLGEPRLTVKQVDVLVGFFAEYINNPNAITAWELTRELRRESRSSRAESLKARAQQLIVAKGISVEDAMNQAIRETMSGELPSITTDYLRAVDEYLRDAMFAKVYHVLKAEPFEMMSTVTALTNALTGKPIPREPGVKGRSAYSRLQRVFGEQPKVLKAIEKIATEKKPLEDIVEGIFHETGREPIPIDQETADYLRGLADIPFGQIKIGEETFAPSGLEEKQTTEEIARGTLELRIELAKQPQAVTRYEAPIEDAFKQMPLLPRPAKEMIYRVLKEIGMFPVDFGNFLRANKASFDFSFWRQQAPLIASHPISFVQANIEAWKALWSQKSAEASWQRITRDPLYQIYEEAERQGGDFLRPLELKKGTAQYKGTEEFGFFKGVARLLPKLTGKLPWIKLSARAFETGTNVHNWLIFKSYYNAMLKLSEQYASGQKKLKVGEAFNMTREMVDFSRMLANFSARGSLGKFQATAPELSGLFFAPRAAIGRILSVGDLINANPRVRLEAWKNAATFVSTLGGIVLLGAAVGWWDVEKDPQNAEYMSIRIGNTRIDPWGGYRQFLVFFARAITGTGVSSVTGAEYEADPINLIQTFIRGKASPLASLILDFWRGKNFIGEEVDVADKRQWAERVAPFAVWDIYEAYKDDPTIGLMAAIPAIVGAGVQTYTGDWKENFPKLGLPKYSDNLAYGLTEPYYDTADFWADTSAQFKGVDPASLTPQKGYPPYIKAIAEARIILEHLDTLPNEKLVNLNADPAKGATFAQYYQMWRDREALVASGDEEKLKEFDKDERTKNAHLGNLSQRQFALLNEYWSITDKEKQVEFLKEHEAEIGINPRQDWLNSHPKENAALAIWGQAKIPSLEVYNEFKKLLAEYDIPDKAIPELTLPPKASVGNYFEREKAVQEYGANSAEAMIILGKDPELLKWLKLDAPEQPVRYYELKVKNRAEREYYQLLADKEIPETYIEGLEERRAKFFEKFPKSEYFDDERRIEGIANNFSDDLIEAWVERGKLSDEHGGSSPQVKLWAFDNLDAYRHALNQKLISDKGGLPTAEDRGLYVQWSYEAIKLRVENTEEYKYWQSLSDKEKPATYIEDIKDRWQAFGKKFPYSDFRLDLERIEAFEKFFTPEEAELWAKRGDIAFEYGPASAEVKVFLADHPDLYDKAVKAEMLEPASDKWNIPALRIDVAWREKTAQYEAIPADARNPETGKLLRDEFLAKPENAEFRIARRQRDFYVLEVPDTNNALRDKYVGYYELPQSGYFQERYRLNNPDLDAILTDPKIMAQPLTLLKPEKIPDKRYDEIYLEFQDLFELYNSYEQATSPNYIADGDKRQATRGGLLARNPDFQQAIWERDAYLKFIGKEEFVPDYVGYYVHIKANPKPSTANYWFEDDWYLLEHPEFYKAMTDLYVQTNGKDGWKPGERDFSRVPPKNVYEMYLVYDSIIGSEDMSQSVARRQYRRNHPELDAWLFLIGAVSKTIEEYDLEAGLTTEEKIARELLEKRMEIDKLKEEIQRKLKGMK